MRLSCTLLGLGWMLLGLAGCGSRESPANPTPTSICTYSVSPSAFSIPARDGTYQISVTTAANCSWTVTTNASWIALLGSGATGNGQIQFSVTPNSTLEPRTGFLNAAQRSVSVRQAAGATPPPNGRSQPLDSMLQDLPGYITSALLENRELLPRNPQLARQIQDKIALLQNANLLNEITQGQFWSEGTAVSLNGRTVPIVAIFPVGTMRNSASQAVSVLEQAVPVLETFLQIAFPPDVIRLWYGFKIGASGAGGVLYLEDRETYEARWFPGLVLYEPMVVHELSHTYVLHEGLNQFLELYGYNVVRSSSQNVQAWTFTRDYVAGRGSNDGVHALLDVYQWIGPQAMSNAYRTIYGIRPPYGQPLSSECRQAFVDQAPTALKAQVAEKMAKVVY